MKNKTIDQETIVARMQLYVERQTRHRNQSTRIRWRQIGVWCLYEHFGMYPADMARALGCPRVQPYRDLKAAEFFVRVQPSFRDDVERMRQFIAGR